MISASAVARPGIATGMIRISSNARVKAFWRLASTYATGTPRNSVAAKHAKAIPSEKKM